jgi:Na+/H+ antiporter NhaD/arsenite permease-like protein
LKKIFSRLLALILLFGGIIVCLDPPVVTLAQSQANPAYIAGKVLDPESKPIPGVQVTLSSSSRSGPSAQTQTQADGSFILPVPAGNPGQLDLNFHLAHYQEATIPISADRIQSLLPGQALVIPSISLAHQINLAFWIATLVFILMLVLIATGIFHNTLAALLSAVLLFAFSYLGSPLNENFFIFDFQKALTYIDWDVIFLIMGMMIVVAVVERTGVFQWLAFFAFRTSGGRIWLLLIILMLITGVVSAFLDNVTTMLLMAPITIQMAITLEMNPLALLLPEVLSSNVVGISTLIGTPTNILIGSFAKIGFNQFLVNQTPGVVLALIGLIIYCLLSYKDDLQAAGKVSPVLLEKLKEEAKIKQPNNLKKAGLVGAAMIILFVTGQSLHLLPAVTALFGATALMIWIRPNVDEMIDAVDWTTLVFFISLFIVVGGVQEVGLISLAAEFIGQAVGSNLMLTMLVITWFSAILSTIVANIPFTAAILPIIGYLSANIPGADNKVLFFCLSVGAAMGGNGSLIGASANLVTAGIARQAGYPLTFGYFLKKGFPALFITVLLAFLWLLLRFK